jgi:hypothetical protein
MAEEDDRQSGMGSYGVIPDGDGILDHAAYTVSASEPAQGSVRCGGFAMAAMVVGIDMVAAPCHHLREWPIAPRVLGKPMANNDNSTRRSLGRRMMKRKRGAGSAIKPSCLAEQSLLLTSMGHNVIGRHFAMAADAIG